MTNACRCCPALFVAQAPYEEHVAIAMRAGHPFADAPTLDRCCEMQHRFVSRTGDAFGLLDEAVARLGRSRRVALTVPNFMQALALVAETDLIAALPSRLVARHAGRFGLTSPELPVPLRRGPDPIRAVATRAALMDPGVAWLLDMLRRAQRGERAETGTDRAA